MIVQCNSVDAFLENLKLEQFIFQDTIRISTTRTSLDSGPPHVTFRVTFHASAVILVDHESQYLLQVGVDCDKDHDDATQSMDGSEMAKSLKLRIEEYAKSRNLKVLPGIISI